MKQKSFPISARMELAQKRAIALIRKDEEIAALRESIENLKEVVEAMACRCATEGIVCARCWILGHMESGMLRLIKDSDQESADQEPLLDAFDPGDVTGHLEQ